MNSGAQLFASASKDESIVVWNFDLVKQANANSNIDSIVSVMQGHTNVIDCIAWAPFECAKTIQQADFNYLKSGEDEASFGADNGTALELETAEKPSQ